MYQSNLLHLFGRRAIRSQAAQFVVVGAAMLVIGVVSCSPVVAQNNQTTVLQTPANQGRTAPAPWRPSFGTISRQTTGAQTSGIINPSGATNPGTIPPRQQVIGQSGGLAAPNSPYNSAPTAINLQTGTTTPIGSPINPAANNRTLPATTTGTLQFPSASTNGSATNQATNPATTTPTTIQQQTQTSGPATTLPASASQANSQSPTQQSGQQQAPFIDPVTTQAQGTITRVTKSMTQLPNDAGQVWREYDITPYTNQMTGTTDPQQAILDWVLRETGTEMWFGQPLGILNADKNQLRVYHTPEIQNIVHKIVDRFVNTRGQVQNLEVSLVTVGKPNWRSTAYPVLQPIEVQSPGVEAWMISKENAALLRSSLARRSDFKDQGTGRISHNDGQAVVLRNTQPVQFVRNFRWTANQIPPYQPLVTTIDEGYTLEISSLTSLDGNTIEAAIECHVDQVEKLNTVKVEVPGSVGATTDKISLQIPQVVSWRLKERFRWQNDQVLLLSCGVVANPAPQTSLPTNLSLPSFLGGNRQRADALLFVDYRGPDVPNGPAANTAQNRTVPVSPRR